MVASDVWTWPFDVCMIVVSMTVVCGGVEEVVPAEVGEVSDGEACEVLVSLVVSGAVDVSVEVVGGSEVVVLDVLGVDDAGFVVVVSVGG